VVTGIKPAKPRDPPPDKRNKNHSNGNSIRATNNRHRQHNHNNNNNNGSRYRAPPPAARPHTSKTGSRSRRARCTRICGRRGCGSPLVTAATAAATATVKGVMRAVIDDARARANDVHDEMLVEVVGDKMRMDGTVVVVVGRRGGGHERLYRNRNRSRSRSRSQSRRTKAMQQQRGGARAWW